MADLSLPWGGDFQVDETGDILTVDGTDEIVERAIRRLLTNPCIQDLNGGVISDPDCCFAPTYGGGLRAYVDGPIRPQLLQDIENRVRHQLTLENSIDMTIPPTVKVTALQNGIQLSCSVATPNGQIVLIPQMEITT